MPRRQHADDPYRLHPDIRCDWTEFRTLTDHALEQGADGLDALEAALALVAASSPVATSPWTATSSPSGRAWTCSTASGYASRLACSASAR
ncbi:hypothetical protein [Streptomyces sp. 2231.1]|uniref:hypothetical protein n=1 Tax=Streptomyces sp. 2231.1 TaxID=1855347 RepID=UPI0015A45917